MRIRVLQQQGKPEMTHFVTNAGHLLRSEDGAAAVEYAVMLALIIGVCLTSVGTLGQSAKSVFERVNVALSVVK
jgi:pilus assembly protein Flp/PilA